jgi:hypothetical protein
LYAIHVSQVVSGSLLREVKIGYRFALDDNLSFKTHPQTVERTFMPWRVAELISFNDLLLQASKVFARLAKVKYAIICFIC